MYSFAPHDYFSHWICYYFASNCCIHWIHCICTSSNYYRLLVYECRMDLLLSMLLQCLDWLCANLKYLSYSSVLSRLSVFQFHILRVGKGVVCWLMVWMAFILVHVLSSILSINDNRIKFTIVFDNESNTHTHIDTLTHKDKTKILAFRTHVLTHPLHSNSFVMQLIQHFFFRCFPFMFGWK